MRTLTVCTMVLLGLPHLCHGGCLDFTNLNTIGHLDSSIGIGHTILVFSTPDILVCMVWCHRLSMCRSVDLNRERSECRLNVKSSIQDPSLLRTTIGSIHVDKEKFPKQLVFDGCHAHLCDNYSMCVSGVCVPVFSEKTCRSPPTVANAEDSPPGLFSVGHTHNYKCTVDYVPFYEPYTTCQDDGKWTDVVIQCIGGQTQKLLIVKACRSPPTVVNAEDSPLGLFPVGHTHNYKCTVDYVPFYETSTTCQDDGKWTDVVFQCLDNCTASGNILVDTYWCYFFGDFNVTDSEAKTQCAARGMTVPIIETQQEWQAVVPHLVNFTNYWLDAYAEYNDWPNITWYWNNSQPMGSYQPWKIGQPYHTQFGEMKLQADTQGWHVVNDTWAEGYFMCEKNV